MRIDGEAQLAARSDEDHLRFAAGSIGEHIGAACDPGGGGVFAPVQCRQRLARQHQHGRLVPELHDVAVSFHRLRWRRPAAARQAPGWRASEASCSTGWCVGPSSPSPMASWREDEDRGQFHERRQADGGPRIVAEDEEGRAECPELRQRQAVDDRHHGVLADAEMQVPAAGRLRLEVSGAFEFQHGLVGGPRSAEPPRSHGNVLRQHVEHLARGVAPGESLGIRPERPEDYGPSPLAVHAAASGQFPCRGRGTFLDSWRRAPSHRRRASAAAHADAIREMLAHTIGNQELRVLGPAVSAFDEADLFFAQRLAMGRRRVVFVRRTVADVAVQDDEGRPSLGLAKTRSSAFSMRPVSLASPTRRTFQP